MHYIDPVCHKNLKKKQEYAIIKIQDKAYHLCCLACKSLFEKYPNKYLKKTI